MLGTVSKGVMDYDVRKIVMWQEENDHPARDSCSAIEKKNLMDGECN